MLKPRVLRVVANPYAHLDHEGRPAGAVLHEPHPVHFSRSYVGARIASAEKVGREPEAHEFPTVQDQDLVWEFDAEPVNVPDTAYYRHHLAQGDLIPADAATSKALGRDHVEPAEALEAAKEAAHAKWHAAYGERPTADVLRPKPPEKAPETPTAPELPAEPAALASREVPR